MTRASDTARLLGAGATILDGATITTADNTAQLTLVSTDADSSSGAILEIQRDSASPADGDAIGQIKFTADNDAGQSTLYGTINGTLRDASDGTEDGQMQFNTMVNGTTTDFIRYGVGGDGEVGVIFNEGSIDADFRVESNGQANMLFVDGGNNRVGINTGSPASGYMLHVGGSSGVHTKVKIEATTATGQAELDLSADPAGVSYLNLGDEDSSNIGYLGYFHSDNSMRFQINAAERIRILSTGFTKHADNGTYRASAGNYHEMTTSTTSGGNVSAFQNASYADGGIQSIAVRASGGVVYRFFEGYSNNAADREFRVDSDGTVRADGAYSSAGGDYAEMFEWSDGNTTNEDRVGKTVVLDGNQIRLSTSSDAQSSIIGVVSARPVILGDAQDEKWIGKYETDSYGRYVFEEYTQTEWTEESDDGTKELKTYQTDIIPSDVTAPDDAKVTSEDENGVKLMRRKLNSSYDATQTYTPRVERKEFSAIGLVGKLRVNVGQTVGDRWIKMREISDTVHEYLVR